ncbi:MAG: hypothetical protein KatS3mg042_0637 [Rhodothermaceae bacterium]|nr:MAG: hypothetical protein KatS3mg042_0637 [Rhodothermaceae bacterium]
MKHRLQSPLLALLLATLLLGAGCQPRQESTPTPSDAPDPSAMTTAPRTLTVTISSDGTFSPDPISPNPGDTVAFMADGTDVVLCVEPASLFGGERYEIPAGTTLPLEVQPDAIHISFAYVAILGDLSADCVGARGGEGGGRTGP